MPRKRALKSEVADGIREVGMAAKAPGTEINGADDSRNRRIRNLTYGGVRGRRA